MKLTNPLVHALSLFATLFATFALAGQAALAGPDIIDIGLGYETDFNNSGANDNILVELNLDHRKVYFSVEGAFSLTESGVNAMPYFSGKIVALPFDKVVSENLKLKFGVLPIEVKTNHGINSKVSFDISAGEIQLPINVGSAMSASHLLKVKFIVDVLGFKLAKFMNNADVYEGVKVGGIGFLAEYMVRESLWDTVTFGVEIGANADLSIGGYDGTFSEQSAEAKLIIQLYGVRLFVSGAATGLYRAATGEWNFAPIFMTGVAYHF